VEVGSETSDMHTTRPPTRWSFTKNRYMMHAPENIKCFTPSTETFSESATVQNIKYCYLSMPALPILTADSDILSSIMQTEHIVAFRWQQWLRERATILRYMYTACLQITDGTSALL